MVLPSASWPIAYSFSFTVQRLGISVSGFLSMLGMSRLVDSENVKRFPIKNVAFLVLNLLGRKTMEEMDDIIVSLQLHPFLNAI